MYSETSRLLWKINSFSLQYKLKIIYFMIRIQFKEQEVQALRYERFHNPSARIQQKMEAVYLKSKDLPHREICRICEISKPTLITYLKEYKQGGIKQLKVETKYKGATKEVKGTTMGFSGYTPDEHVSDRCVPDRCVPDSSIADEEKVLRYA